MGQTSVLCGVTGGCWVELVDIFPTRVAYSKDVLTFIVDLVASTKLELRCDGHRHRTII